MVLGQQSLAPLRPFDSGYDMRLSRNFRQSLARSIICRQSVEVIVMQLAAAGKIINAGEGERGTHHHPLVAEPSGQALYEGRFSAPKVAHKLDGFAALKKGPQACGESLRVLGPDSRDFVDHA